MRVIISGGFDDGVELRELVKAYLRPGQLEIETAVDGLATLVDVLADKGLLTASDVERVVNKEGLSITFLKEGD